MPGWPEKCENVPPAKFPLILQGSQTFWSWSKHFFTQKKLEIPRLKFCLNFLFEFLKLYKILCIPISVSKTVTYVTKKVNTFGIPNQSTIKAKSVGTLWFSLLPISILIPTMLAQVLPFNPILRQGGKREFYYDTQVLGGEFYYHNPYKIQYSNFKNRYLSRVLEWQRCSLLGHLNLFIQHGTESLLVTWPPVMERSCDKKEFNTSWNKMVLVSSVS